MTLFQALGALELGLVYGFVALAIFISFRVLRFPDLTVDGSFPLGGALCAGAILWGFNPWIALALAMTGGLVSGMTTGILCHVLKIQNILSGILSMSALYSVTLRVMGGSPNLSIMGRTTIYSSFQYPLVILVLLSVSVVLGLTWFLKTEIGLAMRAVGVNPRMAKAQGIRESTYVILGLMISNGLAALSGALFVQTYGFADSNSGVGTIVIGLASLITGESILGLFRTKSLLALTSVCILGSVLYRDVIAIALHWSDIGIRPSDLNLMTSLLVIGITTFPTMKTHFRGRENSN
jgi:putative tryptophan/tyrosine transport system permease protein